MNRDRLDLIYDGSAWTRVIEGIPRECKNNETGAVIVEPWAGIHSMTLTATSNANPAPSLTGNITFLQGNTCHQKNDATITLTRTGDVPAGTPTPDADPIEPLVLDPPGAAFRGTYTVNVTRVAAPNFAPGQRTEYPVTQLQATPTCTRSGDRCMIMIDDGSGVPTFLWFVDGHYESVSTSAHLIDCPSSPTGKSDNPQYVHRLENVDGSSPAQTIRGTGTYTYVGDCAGEFVDEWVATRTGD
ncbi:hypothetical protein [Antrihabitans sp. YC2-6]|uniref:hypothetical protein n=1 Tax=Antrihabitans sp. YC2-6 TaxID=2799498 RepID=UPI0018F5E15E|nr:hypothetical protein [Antrihabitans sp. YC2-6]MBJ8343916.1 hypothetical protein [Antrihabitans sp. YC2-6]